ncbi:MAG TPA: GTPase Era [Bryobacteraceae bacterium]|jgi:GTP-binding protein Era|nr:GTPase Era [Bryobacteraceae bacterium]
MTVHKSGFVSIIGRPNAGKSTLLNALVGQKVSIVADKPQTTRTAIQGVLTTPDAQIVFIDTPGIHKSDTAINKRMMDAVRASLEERDLFIYLVDVTKPFDSGDEKALSVLRRGESTGSDSMPPVIIALNKIDALPAKHEMLPLLEEYQKRYQFEAYLPIAAATGEGLDKLSDEVLRLLPEGPEYFPPDHYTDQPARFLAAELIREKILRATHQEVPHSVTVIIEKWEELPRLIRIFATIVVERAGQKAIVIGSKGSMLKQIGSQAREEMEGLFDTRIYLDLHVKVEADWREKASYLNTVDWRTMTGRDES